MLVEQLVVVLGVLARQRVELHGVSGGVNLIDGHPVGYQQPVRVENRNRIVRDIVQERMRRTDRLRAAIGWVQLHWQSRRPTHGDIVGGVGNRSEEHTSELQSLM